MTHVIQPFHLLVNALAGWLERHQQAIIDMDRDTKYTNDFRGHLYREGVNPVRCPARAPNCSAFAERFVRSIKDECLHRMILFGEASLRRALREYVAHHHTERNHQGVGNRLLRPLAMSVQLMSQFIAANALAVCSITTIVKQPESEDSVFCTIRATK